MSKVLGRIDYLTKIGNDGRVAALMANAEQLERIADALEKQNVGSQMVQVDGREFGRLVHENLSSINVTDGRKGSDEDFG